MRSPAFRATIGAAAWIAIGVAAFLLFRSEQHLMQLTASLRAFDQHAREAEDALADARMAQQAYVAAGQGIAFWMPKVTSASDAANQAMTAMRTSASPDTAAALDRAADATKEFAAIEKRVRDYLKSSQQLMASDVIFTEGSQTAATATREVEAARTAEHDALESTRFAVRKQEAIVLAAAAGVVAIAVLVLIPSARRAQDDTSASGTISIAPSVVTPTAQTQPQAAAAPAPVVQAPPVPQNSAATDTLKAAAALATDFGRVRDLPDLQRLLARAAEAMDASGVMVWIGSPAGNDLRPVLAHGYPEDMLARIPPVPRTADNAAAKAYRSGTLQIVLARPGSSAGAVVAPILTADGAIGALSAEIRHGGETSEATQSLSAILAAQLANVLGQGPAAETAEPAESPAAAQA